MAVQFTSAIPVTTPTAMMTPSTKRDILLFLLLICLHLLTFQHSTCLPILEVPFRKSRCLSKFYAPVPRSFT